MQCAIIYPVGKRVINHFKNPVAERQRTLITKAMEFCIERACTGKSFKHQVPEKPSI
ncbi:MAG: hypothetical protein H0U45_09855 [Tatlockia sp.]|nr:hypothetical protein [Tatlockia sp.]